MIDGYSPSDSSERNKYIMQSSSSCTEFKISYIYDKCFWVSITEFYYQCLRSAYFDRISDKNFKYK